MVKNLSKEVVLSYSGGSFVKDTHKCVTRLIRGRDMRQEAVVIILNSFLPPVLDSCFSASEKPGSRIECFPLLKHFWVRECQHSS
jgi:hypothetical protein